MNMPRLFGFRLVAIVGLAVQGFLPWTGSAQEPVIATQPAQTNSGSNASRRFRFFYRGTLKSLPAGSSVRVWLPLAQSNDDQKVNELKWQLPVEGEIKQDRVYGNSMLYFEYSPLEEIDMPFSVEFDVTRKEVNALLTNSMEVLSKELRQRYLAADRLVPVDGPPIQLLDGVVWAGDVMGNARKIYDRVDIHMTYDKSVPGYGNGDVLWACDSKTGNCTDFHSMFISLARNKGIPARFEIGFPLPDEKGSGVIGGYHCWASFLADGKGWIPVDISEADKHPELKDYYFGNLTPNRISFTVGRDINLEPKQSGEALNYFVYPYVEVDGEPWSSEKIETKYSFEDLENP